MLRAVKPVFTVRRTLPTEYFLTGIIVNKNKSRLFYFISFYFTDAIRCVLTNLYNVLYTVSTQQYISTVIKYM